MNIAFQLKNKYFPRKITESAANGDPNTEPKV